MSVAKPANPNPDEDEAKELLRLCRAGRLDELEKWVLDGKPLDICGARKRGRQKNLLEIAVETGFHSMVELIAKHETNQPSKDAALAQAVSSRDWIWWNRPGQRSRHQVCPSHRCSAHLNFSLLIVRALS